MISQKRMMMSPGSGGRKSRRGGSRPVSGGLGVALFFLVACCGSSLFGQWHASADWKALREKAVIDAGELTLRSNSSRDGEAWESETETAEPQEAFEWLELRGFGVYCMPRSTVPGPVSREAVLLLMDVERKVYIGILQAAGGLVRAGVYRADLVKCP